MADAITFERLASQLRQIAGLDVVELAERKSLGDLNFSEIKDLLDRTIRHAAELVSLPLRELPAPTLDALSAQFDSVFKALQDLYSFKVTEIHEGVTSVKYRDDLQEKARTKCEAFLNYIIQIIPYLKLNDPSFKAAVEKSTDSMSELSRQLTSNVSALTAKVDEKIASLDSALQVTRDTAAQTGVTRHAAAFKDAANAHAKSSTYWLIASALLVVLTVAMALLILFEFPSAGLMNDAGIIQKIIARLVIVSILYYSVVWSAKNYKAHRHLSVLNSHRQNALQTFESFVEGAGGDEQTKNAVLLEATHCIFSPANTGYLGAEEDNPTSRIVEILKTVGTSSK
jgi:hypothetical protein